MKSGEAVIRLIQYPCRVSSFHLSCALQSITISQLSFSGTTAHVTFTKRDTPQEEDGYDKE